MLAPSLAFYREVQQELLSQGNETESDYAGYQTSFSVLHTRRSTHPPSHAHAPSAPETRTLPMLRSDLSSTIEQQCNLKQVIASLWLSPIRSMGINIGCWKGRTITIRIEQKTLVVHLIPDSAGIRCHAAVGHSSPVCTVLPGSSQVYPFQHPSVVNSPFC